MHTLEGIKAKEMINDLAKKGYFVCIQGQPVYGFKTKGTAMLVAWRNCNEGANFVTVINTASKTPMAPLVSYISKGMGQHASDAVLLGAL